MLAIILALVSLLVALASAVYAWRSARAAEASADVARDQHRRSREPQLRLTLAEKVDITNDAAIYHIVNDGPDDLDSVVIHRPETTDHIRHPVAPIGGDWGEFADLGPMKLGEEKRFILSVGVIPEGRVDPRYRVRIVSQRSDESWHLSRELEEPRFRVNIY